MDSGSPLILFLIIKLLELIGYICGIISLPLTLYAKLVQQIIKKNDDINRSKGTHLLLCLPRIIIVLPFFPIAFLGLSYLYGWLISKAIPDHKAFVPFVIALGALAVNVIGFFFTVYKFPSVKIKLGDYFKQVGQAFADFGAIIAFFLSIVTVVRIPFMLYTAMSSDSGVGSKKKTVRQQLYLHMLLIITDIICLPLLAILLVLHWRFQSLRHHRKNRSVVFSFELRVLVFLEFIKLFWDFFVFITSIFLLLAPYRIPMAYRDAKATTSFDDGTVKWMRQVLWAMLDVLFVLLFAIFIVPTVYRIYFCLKDVFDSTRPNRSAGSRRFDVLKHMWYIFVDFFIVLFMLCIIPTIYRLPKVVRKIKDPQVRDSYRQIIFDEWLKLIRDIPFWIMGFFVLLLVWRAPFMIRDYRARRNSRDGRRIMAHHFGWLFIDLIDTPFILCSLIILITGWRAYFFVRGFPTGVNRWVQRRYIIKQFVFLLLDIPTIIAFGILMLTVYRAKTTIRQLKEARIFHFDKPAPASSGTTTTVSNVQVNANNDDDEDNPVPTTVVASEMNHSWHQIVGKQFFLLIIDIPFPILLLMTMWRLPILIGRLREIDDPSRKYAQRRLLILRYLLYVLFDILCIVPIVIIFITLWRIPSFIKMIREYKRGDNEHRDIALIFQKLIIDIPFVILGIITLVFPWRGIFLIRTVIKECKSDKESRIMALRYFGLMFTDIISFFLMLIVFITLWRIKSFVRILKERLKEEKQDDKWRQTKAVYYSSLLSFALVLLDLLGVLQSIVILFSITRVKKLWLSIQKEKLAAKPEDPFELEDVRPHLSFYFMETLRDLPHIVFAPIKLVGLLFYPLHLYLSKRTKSPTNSFLNLILIWLHECSINFMVYWEFDKFAIFNIVGGIISIPNEIGIFLVGFNCIYMFLVTLGSPIWNEKRIASSWTHLGKAQGPMVILEYITVILQALLFPLFLFMQGLLLLLPIIVSLGAYNVQKLGFVDYWHAFFSDRRFWHDNAKEFSGGIWFLQAFWVLVMLVCWNVTFLVGKKYFPLFSPWKAYYWLIKKVFVGRFWGFYKMVLSKSTYVCYRLRRACFIGEILMFPLFIIWTCWPLVIPIVTKIYYIFIPCGLLTGFFMFMSYRIIKDSWGEPVPTDCTPKVMLTGVFVDIPEDGGIVFTFEGQKNPQFTIADAALSLNGDEIWKTIEAAMGKTKVRAALMFTGYPISLCPQFLKIDEVNEYKNNISFKISIGTSGSGLHLKKKVLVRTVNNIMKHGNPTFDFVVEYGKKDFGWKKQGILCQYNTSLSIILDAGIDQSSDHHGAIPIPDQQQPIMMISDMPPSGSSPPPPPPPPSTSKKTPLEAYQDRVKNLHQQQEQRRLEKQEEDRQKQLRQIRNGSGFNQNDYQLNQSYDTDLAMAIALSLAEQSNSNDNQQSNTRDDDNINQNLAENQDLEMESLYFGNEENTEEQQTEGRNDLPSGQQQQPNESAIDIKEPKKEENEQDRVIDIQDENNNDDSSSSSSDSVDSTVLSIVIDKEYKK